MNYDIAFNIALYLPAQDLKQFLLVNLKLLSDQQFWRAKIDNFPTTICTATEYFKISKCKQNAKIILAMCNIEYIIGGIINNGRFIATKAAIEQSVKAKMNWKGYHDGAINIRADKNAIMITITGTEKYTVYYYHEEKDEIKTTTEIETILTIALYAGWEITDDHEVPFITYNNELPTKDEEWSDRQIITFDNRVKVLSSYNS